MKPSLQELQRRVAAAVTEPLTSGWTMRKRRHDGTSMRSESDTLIKPNAALSSFERLEIYNRQYWFRLYSSLEDDFPGLRSILGTQRFDRVIREYVVACPSRSFTLRDLGGQLHEFLLRRRDLIEPRTGVALDMARLEWAHIEAYDAAEYPVPDARCFAAATEKTIFPLQPFVRLLDLSYPVDDLLIALRQEEAGSHVSSNSAQASRRRPETQRLARLVPNRIWLAVHRQDFTVYYKRLSSTQFQILTAIQAGCPLGDALSQQTWGNISDLETIQDAFQQWAALGWFSSPESH